MSLKLSAHFFMDAPLSEWDGTAWSPLAIKGALLTRQDEDKFRTLLVAEDAILPSTVSVAAPSQVYLVGQDSAAVNQSIYSRAVLLRRAPLLLSIVGFVYETAASGVQINGVRTIMGTVHGDIETATFNNSKKAAGVMKGEADVILPYDAAVGASMELEHTGKIYKIQGTSVDKGVLRCSCTVTDAP